MKTYIKSITTLSVVLLIVSAVSAKENVGIHRNRPALALNKVSAGCPNTQAKTDLDINNVRAKIFTGGDMWWDLAGTGKYEVPKGSGKTSMYAASLWIGGIDGNNQLKVAAQTYRQTGNDFWAGPVSADPATGATDVSLEDCNYYDRHWILTKESVRQYVNTGTAGDAITAEAISSWPGNGDVAKNQLKFLAPFFDANGNGVYEPNGDGSNPLTRDFPYFRDINPDIAQTDYPNDTLTGKPLCKEYLFGDKLLWWVFNDVGNIKTETNSDPIGLEIRAQAFAFQTADAINNMTFYQYQVINRSIVSFDSTYIGNWADPDLGYYNDDFAGCDAGLGLGFVYNGDALDDLPDGYGENPPAIGIDYFQGPLADVNDGLDNDRDGCVDCTNIYDANGILTGIVGDDTLKEQISMALFNSFINDNNPPNGNPNGLNDVYHYLTGSWRDGLPITFGGTGYDPNSVDYTNFMFPGTTDPAHPNQNWTEAGNTPTDKRIVQSAGPFTLGPGAVNYVTTGVVWARATSGGPSASVGLLKSADEKAQALFNNCFKVLDGPNAPDMEIRELDKKLIVKLVNTGTKFTDLYSEIDPTIPATIQPDVEKRKYRFQGYKLYQVADNSVTANDLNDLDRARLIAQVDLKDDVSELVNYDYVTYNDLNNHGHWSGTLKAYSQSVRQEANRGLKHAFVITRDEFTQQSIINHKSYYYLAVSYAYNNFAPFTDSLAPDVNFTQQHPFFQGRLNVKVYSGIPHAIEVENNGTQLNSAYGDLVSPITRIEGAGNGGHVLDFATGDQEALSPPYIIKHPTYVLGKGPINIRIYDPSIVTSGNYDLKFDGVAANSNWTSTELNTGAIEQSDLTLGNPNQQLLKGDVVDNGEIVKTNNWGIMSDDIATIPYPIGYDSLPNNGFLEATQSFSSGSAWLTGVTDAQQDWILSGPDVTTSGFAGFDDSKTYEKVLGGTWAPFKLAANDALSPKWNSATLQPVITMNNLSSVDVVLTNDKSKWTRSLVLESATSGAILGAARFDRRKSHSVNKDGDSSAVAGAPISTDPNDPNYIDTIGMGWFPGYAINIETGERLNIAFAENSGLPSQNGADMKWNPTSEIEHITSIDTTQVLGGMHYVYIFGHNGNLALDIPGYDACYRADSLIKLGNTGKRNALKDIIWCSIPLSVPGQGWQSSDARIRLRVSKTFKRFNTNTDQGSWLGAGATLTVGQQYYVYAYGGSAATTAKKAVYDGITYGDGDYIKAISGVTTFSETGTTGYVTLIPISNGGNPYYTYGVEGSKVASMDNTDKAKTAMDLINIVPNPYYAYSSYEKKQNDNWAKIVNLPSKCTISIYTLAGKLVRRFNRGVNSDLSGGTEVAPSTGTEAGSGNYDTSLDWDLRNGNNVPIGSGVYLIHVKADGLGERTLKWFAVMRPIDVDAY